MQVYNQSTSFINAINEKYNSSPLILCVITVIAGYIFIKMENTYSDRRATQERITEQRRAILGDFGRPNSVIRRELENEGITITDDQFINAVCSAKNIEFSKALVSRSLKIEDAFLYPEIEEFNKDLRRSIRSEHSLNREFDLTRMKRFLEILKYR